jgi:DNA replication protein DnaD
MLNEHRPADKYATIDTMNDDLPSKWGQAAEAGFQIIPDILLTSQSKLGLTSTDMLVLLNLTMDWQHPDQRQFARSKTIADRLGCVIRTVQRALATLRRLGLLAKVKETSPDGKGREVCDLSGLVKRLVELAGDDPSHSVRTKRREARHAQ